MPRRLGTPWIMGAALLIACGGKVGGLGPADAGAATDGTIISPPGCGGTSCVGPTDGGLPTGVTFACGYEPGEACDGEVFVDASDGNFLVCEGETWVYSEGVALSWANITSTCDEDATAGFDGAFGDDDSTADDTDVPDATVGDDSTIDDDGGFFDGGGDDVACETPDGGPPCSPGSVACGTTSCVVPSSQCCVENGGASSCRTTVEPDAGLCSGQVIQCDETADCPSGGSVCCLNVTLGMTTATTSCQAGPNCPVSETANAQICKSDTECASGECILYNCAVGVIEACKGTVQGPLASTCTPTP